MKTFSITGAIKSGWALFKLNKGVLISASFVVIVLYVLQSYQKKMFLNPNLQTIVLIVLFIIGVIIHTGYFKILLKINDGMPTTFSEIFSHFNLFWKYFELSVLMAIVSFLPSVFVLVVFSTVLFLHLSIFLIPVIAIVGIALFVMLCLFIGLRLPFSFIILVDKEIGPVAAMKESARITKGMKWDVFCFLFALGIVELIGIIALGVGILAAIPVSMLAMINVYRTLSKPVVSETITVPQSTPI
jgi:hypothetical protein